MSTQAIQALNLLIIDDDPLFVQKITKSVKEHVLSARLHLIDDTEEFNKSLRQQEWDAILFGNAYDLTIIDAIDTIAAAKKDIPVIALKSDEPDTPLSLGDDTTDVVTQQGFAVGAADVIERHRMSHLTAAIWREVNNLRTRQTLRTTITRLQDADARSQAFLENSRSAVATIQEGVHILANEAYVELFGYVKPDDLLGVPVIDLVKSSDVGPFKELLRQYSKGERNNEGQEFHGVRLDGSEFKANFQLFTAVKNGEPCLQMVVQPDEAQQSQAMVAAKVAAAVRIDPLTRLKNRLAFEEQLEETRSRSIALKKSAALLFISLDNIGQINATHGLAGNDAVILALAEQLKTQFDEALVYRFGDASFTVLIQDSDEAQAVQSAEALVQSAQTTLINVDKRTIQTTVSIGIVIISDTSPSSPDIFKRAFEAADKVKLKNKGVGNGVDVYRPAEHATTSDTALRELIEHSLINNKFELLYQPLYDTENEENLFYEVFIRLPLTDGKTMKPAEFIPVVQQFGLEGKLDRWLILNACKQLKLHLQAYPNSRLLLNLSAESLQDSTLPALVSRLGATIGPNGRNPLVLQFHESDITTYLQLAKENIASYRVGGCGVSITDFGQSLNALTQLTMLDVSMVKLDKSYIREMDKSENFQAVQSMIEQITAQEKEAIIGYIETPAIMSKAWSVGARYLQGYYLQPPSTVMVTNESE